MGRISEEELARLKAAVPLKRLVEAKGVELRRVGKDWVGLCPLHQGDTEPSFHITEGSPDLFHCFACSAGGDAISWLRAVEPGLSFRHAVEVLRRFAGEPGAEVPRRLGGSGGALQRTADDQALLLEVVELYHQNLLKKPEALRYLEKRGLCDAELIAHARLGYADRTIGYELGKGSDRPLRHRLKGLGILREKTGHEHFSGCLVAPILDDRGLVVQLYGRRIGPVKGEAAEHLYLKDCEHTVVWNVSALAASKEVVLCEAILDGCALWVQGVRNVVACPGANHFTERMLEPFVRRGIERVYLALDPDEAGERGARAAAARLRAAGIECLRVEFPEGLDANAFALRYGQAAARGFARLLEAARPMSNPDGPPIDIAGQRLEVPCPAGAAEQPEARAAAQDRGPVDAGEEQPEPAQGGPADSPSAAEGGQQPAALPATVDETPPGEASGQERREPEQAQEARSEAGAAPPSPEPSAEPRATEPTAARASKEGSSAPAQRPSLPSLAAGAAESGRRGKR